MAGDPFTMGARQPQMARVRLSWPNPTDSTQGEGFDRVSGARQDGKSAPRPGARIGEGGAAVATAASLAWSGECHAGAALYISPAPPGPSQLSSLCGRPPRAGQATFRAVGLWRQAKVGAGAPADEYSGRRCPPRPAERKVRSGHAG